MEQIRAVSDSEKRRYWQLLLLADEQESMIERYLDDSVMYVLDENGVKGEITGCGIGNGIWEIKNLAVYPEYQRCGYGSKLVRFVCETFRDKYRVICVGTGDSGLTVPFYEACGFEKTHVVKNFFTENYDHPIFENGKQLVDMVYLQRKL